ncbi:MAG: ribonuclease PH [Clostridiales bacterium]|nr:MAG: ribonuclease PH [Clostridiales bacterium]
MRYNGRRADEPRPLRFTVGYCEYPAGSVLVETGKTRVLCNATVEARVPPYMFGSGKGWVTAEYSMLPAATKERTRRDIQNMKLSPRSAEIQRLIGRSLRSVTDLALLDGLTITVDCDVLQADGGTRTASITGGYLALWLACEALRRDGRLPANPLRGEVAAVSAGIVDGEILLDLDYSEDSRAEADFNMVMTADGDIVELQGTGEERPFTQAELARMLALGQKGIAEICRIRREYMC